jgi:hypothetical protein
MKLGFDVPTEIIGICAYVCNSSAAILASIICLLFDLPGFAPTSVPVWNDYWPNNPPILTLPMQHTTVSDKGSPGLIAAASSGDRYRPDLPTLRS